MVKYGKFRKVTQCRQEPQSTGLDLKTTKNLLDLNALDLNPGPSACETGVLTIRPSSRLCREGLFKKWTI